MGVYCVAFGPDGGQVASGDANGAIHFWTTASGERIRTLGGERGPCLLPGLLPQRTLAGDRRIDTVRLFDLESGKVTQRFEVREGAAWRIAA